MKAGDRLRVTADLPSLWADVPTIPKGTEGRVVKVYPADDDAYVVDLEMAGGLLRTTVFHNELGVVIEEIKT